MFEVKNLTLYHNIKNSKIYLLKDICFSLERGDCLGVLGKSGAGKSTLAKALLKIYDQNIIEETSSIYLDKILFNNSFRGKRISIIFQNPNTYLNPLMKIGKQIDEMLITHLKLSKKEAKLQTIQFMKKAGLPDVEKLYNYFPYEISGGMQQKVCLCIALICNPDVLILDECTSYLDFKSKTEILYLIKTLQKEKKFNIIMISHDLNELYYTCNKLAIMRKGQMIEFGNKDEIISNPIHPHTIELLNDYLRFYENVDVYTCPSFDLNLEKIQSIKNISETHYVRNIYMEDANLKISTPQNMIEIKEKIYEYLNSQQY